MMTKLDKTDIENIKLVVYGNSLFDDIQDAYEAYLFTDYSI